MKEIIQVSKSTKYILISLFTLTILIAVIIFTRNWLTWKSEFNYFRTIHIDSRIVEMRNLNRGNYMVKLNVNDSMMQFDLPISFYVRRDNIKVGDSLSKPKNSGQCEIFRVNEVGISTKVSEFTLN